MNPAFRLHSIVQFFNSVDPGSAMKSAWENYLDPAGSPLAEEELLVVVQAVLAEIRTMEAKLRSIGVPDELFNDCVSQLRTAFSPTQFAGGWINHRDQILKRATPLTLQWAAWVLSQFDENEIDNEALVSLRDSLDAQEKLLSETELPAGLRGLLERQTKATRLALQLYKIQGVAPMRKTVSDSIGEMATASPELVIEVERGSTRVKQAFENGRKLIGKAAELSDKGSKVVKFGKEVYELGTAAWHWAQVQIS